MIQFLLIIISIIYGFIYGIITSLLKKEDELNNEITKMQDSEYAAKYAREKYGYSKDNEVIIKFDD